MLWVLLKNVVLSTLHGWVGASLAVFMFFRPLKPWRIGGIKIWHGVIPAQQERIGSAIGDVVANELLTPKALFDYLEREGALDQWVRSTLHEMVDGLAGREYPGLEGLFPPSAAGIKEEIKGQAREALTRWALKYLTDPETEVWLKGFLHKRLRFFWQKQLGELLPEDKVQETIDFFLDKAAAYLDSPRFRETAVKLLEKVHGELCKQEIPLGEVLPRPLLEKVAEWPAGLAQVLPELVIRLQDNEEVLERLTVVILDIMEQLKEKGILARVGIGLFQYFSEYQKEVEHFVRTDMFPRLSEFLASPEVKLWLERSLRERSEAILARPVGELAGGIKQEQLARIGDWLAVRLGSWLGGRPARTWLNDYLLDGYRALAGQRVADVFARYARLTPEEAENWLAGYGFNLFKRPVTARFLGLAAGNLVDGIAAYPIGRPRDRLAPATLEKIETAAAGLISRFLKGKIPDFLAQMDLQAIVKGKIEGYSTRELVDMFQKVTMNSLQKIELYGAVIGAVMGVFFGLANLRADAFWFIAAVLAALVCLLRFTK